MSDGRRGAEPGEPPAQDSASPVVASRDTLVELASLLDALDDGDTGERRDSYRLCSRRWDLMERVLTAQREIGRAHV